MVRIESGLVGDCPAVFFKGMFDGIIDYSFSFNRFVYGTDRKFNRQQIL